MLELQALGGLTLNGAPSVQPKRLALLCYLALGGSRTFHRRDNLLALFWPELDASHARQSLRQALATLRTLDKQLVTTRGDELVGITPGRLTSDVQSFEGALQCGELVTALERYTGPFLDGFFLTDCVEFERWVDRERARLTALAAAAAWKLADNEGLPALAVQWARRAAALQPDDESALRRLITKLDRAGDRIGALREYDAFARALRDRFQAEPAPETQAAIAAVRRRAASDEPHRDVEPKALEKVTADPFAAARQSADALPTTTEASTPVRRHLLRRRRVVVGLAVTGLVITAGLVWWLRLPLRQTSPPQRPKIVVLPFQNLGASEDRWFADGITAEITSRLEGVSGLAVISRTSALQSAGKPLRQIGNELGAQYVLEGTIRSDQIPGGVRQVRVNPELIRISDDTHLWADRYTASLAHGEIFDVQASIAQHVAQALDVTLLKGEHRDLRTRPTDNPEAYEAYLRGNQYAQGGYVPTDLRAAIDMYRRAVELDPRFSEAHARLSLTYSGCGLSTFICTDSTLVHALQHAQRALDLTPDLAWGHLALATYYDIKGDWAHARTEVALAEKFGTNSGEILAATSWEYWENGEYDRAVQNLERAVELDPISADNAFFLGYHYFLQHRYAEAERLFNRAIALNPTNPDFYCLKAVLYLSWHGSLDEARGVLQTAVQKLGPERAFAAGFSKFFWWLSRILAKDPWYRSLLDHVSLGPPDLDSVNYYVHKAALFEGLGQAHKARVYWDSVVAVGEGRLERQGERSPGANEAWLHLELAPGYAALGKKERAIQEARRADGLIRGDFNGPLSLALTYVAVGEREAAVEQFERVMSGPSLVTPKLLVLDPTLESLRQVQRFQRLLQGQ